MTEEMKDLVARIREYSTTELCDGMLEKHVMEYTISERVTTKKIVGPAYTVESPAGVGGLVPDAILAAEEGQVLVVDAKGWCKSAVWGDQRSLCAVMKNMEGIVIDGAFRDIEGCEEVSFPVFAKALVPNSGKPVAEGTMQTEITCGGVNVRPGDIIVGDRNGVIVIKPEEAEAILERTKAKVAAERYTIERMKKTGEILPRVLKIEK